MERFIYDSANGLWYELNGDYYIPCLVLPDTEERPIGIWGRKHLEYIKEHRPVLYTDLVLSCKLHRYLSDIDTQAQARLTLLIKQMAKMEGITRQLKAQDQMAWVGAMNNICNRAKEVVNAEMIYA